MSDEVAFDKNLVRKSFAAAAVTYDGVAELQRIVGKRLLTNVDVRGTILDLGCGTGFLTRELLSSPHIEYMLAMDIAMSMLQTARNKLINHQFACVCADAERIPLADKTVDMVLSNLALQWCRNLIAAFADIRRILKADGQFLFTTFGPQTLQELKTAWATVDNYRHVNEFYSQTQLQQFLRQAGFSQIGYSSELILSQYDSPMTLMKELKQLGAHNVMIGRNKKITGKAQMQKMLGAYERARIQNMIPATFEVITVSAKI